MPECLIEWPAAKQPGAIGAVPGGGSSCEAGPAITINLRPDNPNELNIEFIDLRGLNVLILYWNVAAATAWRSN